MGALTPAFATHHLMVVQEVFVGPPGDMTNPNLTNDQRAQFVMLRMTSAGETVVSGSIIRVEDKDGNILGNFGQFAANVSTGGAACTYLNCPAILIGTQAAANLFKFAFDKIVDGQTRVALPQSGGRVCFHDGGAATGLTFGKSLARSAFTCAAKENSTDFSLKFPRPVDNAGSNNNPDTDADGLIDILDCNTADATIQWSPIELQHLTISGTPTTTLARRSHFAIRA